MIPLFEIALWNDFCLKVSHPVNSLVTLSGPIRSLNLFVSKLTILEQKYFLEALIEAYIINGEAMSSADQQIFKVELLSIADSFEQKLAEVNKKIALHQPLAKLHWKGTKYLLPVLIHALSKTNISEDRETVLAAFQQIFPDEKLTDGHGRAAIHSFAGVKNDNNQVKRVEAFYKSLLEATRELLDKKNEVILSSKKSSLT